MYYDLYQILANFFYGAGAELTPWMEMTLTVLSTCGILFVFVCPFVVVWGCIQAVIGLCGK